MSGNTAPKSLPLPDVPSTGSQNGEAQTTIAPTTSGTIPMDKPASAETPNSRMESVTGLTPEQVLQELKKSGYVDQLRRQMFDAFTSAASAPAKAPTQTTLSTTSPVLSLSDQPTRQAASSTSNPRRDQDALSQSLAPTHAAAAVLPSVTLPASNSTPAATLADEVDVGTKPAFLNFLAGPLRYQVEKEHDKLRFLDAREQQDNLLKLLESEPVPYAGATTHGDATLYDLLVRHIVMPPTAASATSGMLHKDGSIGKEADSKIKDTIAELLNPASKEADEEEEDEDENDDDDDDDNDEDNDGSEDVTGRVAAPQQFAQTLSSAAT